MPRLRRDPTSHIKDQLMDLIDGYDPAFAGLDSFSFYDGIPSGDERPVKNVPYGAFGPFFFQTNRTGGIVTGQLDLYSFRYDSREIDSIKAEVVAKVQSVEGASYPTGHALTRVEILPSPTLDERDQAGDVTFHAVVRFDVEVFDPQAG